MCTSNNKHSGIYALAEFGISDSNTLVYIRDRHENYVYISTGLFKLMDFPADKKTINPGELWGRHQSDKIELRDNDAWVTGGSQLLDILIAGKNRVFVSYQQRFIFENKMYCVIGVLDHPFVNKISTFDAKKKIFYTNKDDTIRINEIKMLIEYLAHEEVEDAAEVLCKAPITVYKAMNKLAIKLSYKNTKHMQTIMRSSLIVPLLKKLIEL